MSSTKRAPYRASIQFLDGSTRSFDYFTSTQQDGAWLFFTSIYGSDSPRDYVAVNVRATQTIDVVVNA